MIAFSRAINSLTRVPVWIGGLLIIGVIVLTVGDVIARWVFQVGYFGLVDVTQLAVIGFAYLAMPRTFLTFGHVALELYDNRLGPRGDAALRILSLALALAVLSVLLYYGAIQAERTYGYGDVSQNAGIPIIVYWALILFGFALSWLICAGQLVQHSLRLIRPAAHRDA